MPEVIRSGLRGQGMQESPATRASLLVRLRDGGDAGAWQEFVHLYAPIIYGFARKRGSRMRTPPI